MDHHVKKRSGLLSIVMMFMIVFAMMPNMVFADTAEKNLVDYTGLQQGTTSTRIYMLNCGTLEKAYPAVFADKNDYTSRWNIKVNTDETGFFDNYITDMPDSRKEIEFVFSIGGSGMNQLNINDEVFRKGVTDYIDILDTEGNKQSRNVDMIFTPHTGSGGGTGGGPSRAIDVIVKVAPDTLNANETYRLAILSGLSSGRDKLDKDIFFTFTTAPILAESVTLDKTSLTLEEGQTESVEATITPDNVTDSTVVWTSSDEAIATVDENGNVKALKEGNAVIKAVSGDGNASAECQVIVKAAAKDNNDQNGDDKKPDDKNTNDKNPDNKNVNNKKVNGNTVSTGDPMNGHVLCILVILMIAAVITMIVVVRKRQRI